jgi:hypothetical protein
VEGRCLQCLAATIDISEGIDKEGEIEMCRTCALDGVHRWYRNPQWVVADPESAELLSLCIQKLKGIKQVRLVDASWIWQEPHSRRLKLKLTVAKDVLSGRTLQQSFLVGFTVQTRNWYAAQAHEHTSTRAHEHTSTRAHEHTNIRIRTPRACDPRTRVAPTTPLLTLFPSLPVARRVPRDVRAASGATASPPRTRGRPRCRCGSGRTTRARCSPWSSRC